MSDRIRLVKTCSGCPEQYDAFLSGEQVGYLRLRYGCFTVQYPDDDGEVVYSACPDGYGYFYDDDERVRHLNAACRSILNALQGNQKPEPEAPIYDLAAVRTV